MVAARLTEQITTATGLGKKWGLGSGRGFGEEARPPTKASVAGPQRSALSKGGTLTRRDEEELGLLSWKAVDRI